MSNIIINGTITTVGPLSIAMPEGRDYNGFPVMGRGVDSDGKPEMTGYLPATTVRGFLRRAVVTDLMQKAAEAGTPYDLPKAYGELIGQDAKSEQQAGDIDLLELQETRDASPVLDLFGSGLGIASRLRVGHFMPETNILPSEFRMARKDLGQTDGVLEAMSENDQKDYYERNESNRGRSQADTLLTNLRRKKRQLKEDDDPADIDTQIAEAEKIVKKYEKDMGGMGVSSKAIFSHFALPAGLPLNGRMVILKAKERDLEMIEFGLDQLSQNPVLGAQSARGCGEISGSFDVLSDGALKKKITIGGYEPAKIDEF